MDSKLEPWWGPTGDTLGKSCCPRGAALRDAMDSFLQQMTSGLALSDRGTFTQDFRAAARKKTELARREPSLMLGRLLQVAVAWNARSVHFIIDSNDLEVRIKHGGTSPVPVMQDYLKSAFMLAAALEPSDTRWTLAEDEARYRYYEKRLGFWEGLRRDLLKRTRHHTWLFEHCRFSPIPVFLDGCRLNDPSPREGSLQVMEVVPASDLARHRIIAPSPRALGSTRTFLDDKCYSARNLPHANNWNRASQVLWLEGPKKVKVEQHGPQGPGSDYVTLVNESGFWGSGSESGSQWDWMEAGNYRSPATTPTTSATHMVVRYWLSHSPGANYPATLHPVRDGLLLESVTLDDFPPGSRLVMATPDLALDLEERRVIQDEAFQSLVKPIQRRFEEILKGSR